MKPLAISLACVLSAVLVTRSSAEDDAKPKEVDKRIATWKKVQAALQRDGGIADPSIPFAIYAEKVEDNRCARTSFMFFDSTNKRFQLVGWAETLELRFDPSTGEVEVTAKNCKCMKDDGSDFFAAHFSWVVEVPAEPTFKNGEPARLPRREDLPFSLEQRKFLAAVFEKDGSRELRQKRFRLAFGDDCEERHCSVSLYLPRISLLITCDAMIVTRERNIQLRNCSIARFRKQADQEVVQFSIRQQDVVIRDLVLEDGRIASLAKAISNAKALVFETTDGVQVTIPLAR